MTDEEVKRWDEWFTSVGGEYLKQWQTVKELILRKAWLRWATIIELNRIEERIRERKASAD